MSQEQFRMVIEDTFLIKNRGSVIVGKVISGSVKRNDIVTLMSSGMEPLITSIIRSIPMIEFKNEDFALLLENEEVHNIAEQGMFIISSRK